MTELAFRAYEVVAVGIDELTLDVDTTSFSTYSGGATLQNKTGPALLSSGMRTVTMSGAYILTYGAPCIVIDGAGGAPYDWHVQVQFERHSDKPITFKIASGTLVVPQFHISSTQTSQSPKTAVIWVEGGGTLRLDGGSLRISNMATAPALSVLAPQAQINARGFDIDTPLAASLPTPASMVAYSGRTLAQDRTPSLIQHIGQLALSASTAALTGLGLRWVSGGLKAYRPEVSAERDVYIHDVASTAQFTAIGDRINTINKYAGKPVWSASLSRPLYASGGAASAPWVYADGTTAHTPV